MPAFDAVSHYLSLAEASAENVRELTSNDSLVAQLAKSHSLVAELDTAFQFIASRPESVMLSRACIEYQYGLLALCTCKYRHAYLSLRLTMELSLSWTSAKTLGGFDAVMIH